jgi:hypothetical protein
MKGAKAMKTRLMISVVLASAVLSAPAFAVDYAQERGVAPSTMPYSPDETGKVSNPPNSPQAWPATPVAALPQPTVADYFARYDVNRDGVVSWAEAQVDGDLVRAFGQADANRDGALTPIEFQNAALLARG